MSYDGLVSNELKENTTKIEHVAMYVDELTQILKYDGYQLISGPRTTGDGYYESCIAVIEGNRIEITI